MKGLSVWLAAFALTAGAAAACGGDDSGGDVPADDGATDGADADADGDGDADADADGDADAEPDVPDVSDTSDLAEVEAEAEAEADAAEADAETDAGPCCVTVNGIGDAPVELCEGPGVYGGPSGAEPNIVLNGTIGIDLRAGFSILDAGRNALLVQSYGATGSGTRPMPMVEYWNDVGNWFENNAADGSMTIDSWPAVGERVTGAFSGIAYNMDGGSPFLLNLTGTFCAIRGFDR
jgi:hypothetical protein